MEVALWVLVAILALVLRLSRLGAAPLNMREAEQAMMAWRPAAAGQAMPVAGYSPLLFAANALLFTLCGASDSLARLWPALFGAGLALTPCLFRRRIGRLAALVAGFYLAVSPMALLASRQLDGAVLALAGGMMFFGGLVRFSDTRRPFWLVFSSGGLGLAVVSSVLIYDVLLSLGLAWVGLIWTWPIGGRTEGDKRAKGQKSNQKERTRKIGREEKELQEVLRQHMKQMLIVFMLTALALSTGLGWSPMGLGAMGDLLPTWLARFQPMLSGSAPSPLSLLIVYEPFALVFGLGGLVWAVRHGRRLGALLGLWVAVGALALTLMPGRVPLDTLGVLLPLAMLAGVAVESLIPDRAEREQWLNEGVYIFVVMALWIHFWLVLARYSVSGDPADMALALLTVALQGSLAVIFALAIRVDSTLRSVAIGTGVVLLVGTISAGYGVAYVRPADARELLVREPTDVEVRDLVQTLNDLSWRKTKMPLTLPFTYEATSRSVLAWYLRDFSAARRVDVLTDLNVGTGKMEPVLVTKRRDLSNLAREGVSDDVEFTGQAFVLRRSWELSQVGCVWGWPPQCQDLIGWLFFRRLAAPPQVVEQTALWLGIE